MELLNFAVIKNDNLQARFRHISYMVKAAGLNEAFHTQRGNLLLTVKELSCMRLSKSAEVTGNRVHLFASACYLRLGLE